MSDMDLSHGLDLAADRNRRAAMREGKGQDLPITFGDEHITTLPVELPVDVFAPLRELDGDVTLLLREAMNAYQAEDQGRAALVIDLIASNPRLPLTALDTFRQIAENLLTKDGFARLQEHRPSGQDYAFLVKGVLRFYGLSLGEALPSSESSTDSPGGTSPGTSSTTSDSTPVESGQTPAATASLEPAAS